MPAAWRSSPSFACPAATPHDASMLGSDAMIVVERSPNKIKCTGKRYLNIDFYRLQRLEIIAEEEK
jgi:hypothetical protein